MLLLGSGMTLAGSACVDAVAGHTYVIRPAGDGYHIIDRQDPVVVTITQNSAKQQAAATRPRGGPWPNGQSLARGPSQPLGTMRLGTGWSAAVHILCRRTPVDPRQ